ncbi:MAPEG family protein (plasmid) [Pseudoalteromonas sp. CF6-2]|uniref:MAPEG family protein n=1 Tax=Pseudoalteromonas sp. CF6-2 TaxID=562716 RepID=UPI001F389FBC|nr:MAPEG family protein [Pseudoalteromonas sp. CF6-2]|tara:strand:+ start:11085 stop:11498 length:414 start_codon:yes stop_codon:yes gene_type:complete
MEKWLIAAMFTQVLLTFSIMVIMGRRRFTAAKNKVIKMQDFLTMELDKAGSEVRVADRNFINQFEMPILFFIACLTALQVHAAGFVFVILAWLYVGLRLLHSVIHLTTNTLKLRYYSFVVSSFVMLIMWLIILIRIF